MDGNIEVLKHNGEKTKFSEEKLRESLRKSGATERVIDRVFEDILSSLYDGISTKKYTNMPTSC